MLDVNRLIPFLIKTGLEVNEFMILHLQHTKKKALLRQYREKFFKHTENIFTNEIRNKVIKLGYMAKDNTIEGNSYYLTEKFTNLYCTEFEAGNALWDIYPGFTSIDGKNAPLMNTDKNAWRSLYFDTIEGLLHEHEQIMLDTEYGIANGLIKVKIVTYVRSEAWTKIRPIRLGESAATNNSPVKTQINDHDF